jgi:hypothetical protein
MTGSGQRVGSTRAAQLRSIGLAVTLIAALIGGPASSALRNQCDLCPRQCPMHRDRDHGDAATGRPLNCHMAPAGAGHHRHAEHQQAPRGPSVTRATCGNHGVVPATVLPPMILPAALQHLVVPAVQRAQFCDDARRGRAAEPPDTPPPIDAA